MPLRQSDGRIRLFVIGATGRTGRLLVEQALGRGHHVTAFVRDAALLRPAANLDIAAGDPTNPDQLAAALPGHDVVVSILGQSSAAGVTLLRDAASALLAALQGSGVSRVIVVSQGLAFPTRNPIVLLIRRALAKVLADSMAMERLIQAADVDWTIVRPPMLKSGGTARGYRVHPNEVGGRWSMQRVDLAAFLLDEAEKGEYRRTVVGVD
jgi:putative NADH-flavin reductase